MQKNYFIFSFFCLLCFLSALLSGCSNYQEKATQTFQSKGAAQLKQDFKKINTLLLEYKEKLDMRNPNNYKKDFKDAMVNEIAHERNTLSIVYNGQKLNTYDDYLRVAFDTTTRIPNRNDFLIVGLNKLIHATYLVEEGHRFTTLSYQEDSFKRLYYYLEVIKWKIRTAKDKEGNYLFVTWQNNWQIELEKKLKGGAAPSWDMIQNLPSIKSGKETLFDHSNPNFEVILNQMISTVKNSASLVGEEPTDVGISAMLGLVFFL